MKIFTHSRPPCVRLGAGVTSLLVMVKFIKEILMWYVWFGKKILPLVKYGGVILLGLVVVLSFAQNLPAGRQVFPIPGNFSSLVVMSGSMEPKIHVGSVAIVKPSEDIKTGDIITFSDPRDPTSLVTHRIVEISGISEISEPNDISEISAYKTKGDANNTADNWEISRSDIVGKFLFSIPLLGYAVNFAKQPRGFLLFILFPALLIIINEIGSIKREFEKKYEKKKGNTVTVAAIAVGAIFLTFAFSCGATSALFSDTETSSGNTISAGVWDSPEFCVVLNEILPNPEGNDSAENPDGEWVELYNNCETKFDLADWEIGNEDGDRVGFSSLETLDGNTQIGYGVDDSEWFVLYMDGQFLDNSGGVVTIYNAYGDIVNSCSYGNSSGDSNDDSQNSPGSSNSDTDTENPGNEGKSFARIPDGVGDWIDPIPTPGGPNKLEFLIEEEQESEPEPKTEAEIEPEPEPESETENEDIAAAVSAAPEDPPESSESAQPALGPAVPESTESAKPKESDE